MRQTTSPPPASATVERLFTINEIAEMWGVSYAHVHRLIAADQLRSVRVGRLVRIPASALGDYVVENQRTA